MKYNKNFYQIRSNDFIFDKLLKEREKIGYYNLVDNDISNIISFAKENKKKYIVVIGIGGSSLGANAIYSFLNPKYNYDKKLIFLETTDPIDINSKLSSIELNNSLFLVISKSGTTIETIAIFKYINSLIKLNKDNLIIISDSDSNLSLYAKEHNIKNFYIPKNVGGRFSVFSVAALVPLALVGIDIQALLDGARELRDDFFDKQEIFDIIMEKARFMVENKNRFNINVVFSYSSLLEGFNKWYIQLWAESLGKVNINNTRQGLTPIGLIGPIDQHSFLQLIIDGKRDKTVTFIIIKDFQNNIKIPPLDSIGVEFIDNLTFEELIYKQAYATIDAIKSLQDIPFDVFEIDSVDEKSIAKLMFMYQLLVSIIGVFLQINTYNQPGVEIGKKILKDNI